MRRVLIFGNSGSGKSTLAWQLAEKSKLVHLDLDILAWLPTTPPERASLSDSKEKIAKFTKSQDNWVIEGGYTDLLELLACEANEIIFMNLPVDLCVENAKNRPWEPHKYESKEAQDKNLEMLISWIRQYKEREGVFSFDSHMNFYEKYSGSKKMITSNGKNL